MAARRRATPGSAGMLDYLHEQKRKMTFAGKSRQLETSPEQASAVEFGPARKPSAWRTWARAARIHQWPKNLLVFVPAALTVPDLTTLPTIRFFLVFAVLFLFAS